MRKLHLIAFVGSCLLAAFVVSAQASGGHERGPGFTNRSLEGAYYIPCACEGNEISSGGSIHSAGMGKIEFDGEGGATITQQNLYIEIGNQIIRLVKDGLRQDGSEMPAVFSGSYEVDSEGYGRLFDKDFPSKDNGYTPSFMVTKANGRNVTEIYLILPQNFIDPPPAEPKQLIHVTAARR